MKKLLVSGYYMYVESSSPRKAGDKAILQSQVFPANKQYCMSFWYHMKGKSMGVYYLTVLYQYFINSCIYSLQKLNQKYET